MARTAERGCGPFTRDTARTTLNDNGRGGAAMRKKVWTKPTVIEIALGMEINSYACAVRDR